MKASWILAIVLPIIFFIGLCNAQDENQEPEATTAAVSETTPAAKFDITLEDICRQIFCQVVAKRNGKWKYKVKCSRVPRRFQKTCNKCRVSYCTGGPGPGV